ncbi:MAG: HEPN domain-containing protein [Alphaproteobacteria bacterium]|nr:HEPN domain-containing protein [Alphaproteobacteria bacterium]MDA8003325.1 HEPN domain-containing protein [Alphaproteobacteria bacterium]MDA8005336.1 HEPN domain-containing protein [Alphaproteobacteria bacterium]MDA8012610.1 HEPN domain-containing protein [Alphaproteobacteria bacterium]
MDVKNLPPPWLLENIDCRRSDLVPQAHLRHAFLNEKYRRLKEKSGAELSRHLLMRLQRALSWLGQAEKHVLEEIRGMDDSQKVQDADDMAFIACWISFNAVYAEYATSDKAEKEKREKFFDKILERDDGRVHDALIGERTRRAVISVVVHKFLCAEFWDIHHAGKMSRKQRAAANEDVIAALYSEGAAVHDAFYRLDTSGVLVPLFDRLSLLRNQLVHGSASWRDGVNRSQVVLGLWLMFILVPLFIDVIMDDVSENPGNGTELWGEAYYPVIAEGDGAKWREKGRG